MRFITGLLIGLGIGFVAAILFAPEKSKRHEEHLWQAPPGRSDSYLARRHWPGDRCGSDEFAEQD